MSFFGPITIKDNPNAEVSNHNYLMGMFQPYNTSWNYKVTFKTPDTITDTIVVKYNVNTNNWLTLGYTADGLVYDSVTKDLSLNTVTFSNEPLLPNTEYTVAWKIYSSSWFREVDITKGGTTTSYAEAKNPGVFNEDITESLDSASGFILDPDGKLEFTDQIILTGTCYNSIIPTTIRIGQSAWGRRSNYTLNSIISGYGEEYGSTCALITFENAHKVLLNYTMEQDVASPLDWGVSDNTAGYPRYKYYTSGEYISIPMADMANLYKGASFSSGASKDYAPNIAFIGWRHSTAESTAPEYDNIEDSEVSIGVMGSEDITMLPCKLFIKGSNYTQSIVGRTSAYAHLQVMDNFSSSEPYTNWSDLDNFVVEYSRDYKTWYTITPTREEACGQYNIYGTYDDIIGVNKRYIRISNNGLLCKGGTTSSYLTISFTEFVREIPSVVDTLIYNGTEQSPILSEELGNSIVKSGDVSKTYCGTYALTITLVDGSTWAGGETSATLYWSIYKLPVTFTLGNVSYTYDKNVHSASLSNISKTDMAEGDYLSEISLNDSEAVFATDVSETECLLSNAVILNSSLEDVTNNYEITYVGGKLIINACPININWFCNGSTWYDEVDSYTYDAVEKVFTATCTPISGDECNVLLSLDGFEEQESVKITDVKLIYGEVTYYDISAYLTNANYAISSDSYSVRYLTINKKSILCTSDSASKIYDGLPLTFPSEAVSGKIEGHYYVPTFTGTVTNAISVPNTFTINCYSDEAHTICVNDNYNISYNYGTLRVEPVMVAIPKLKPLPVNTLKERYLVSDLASYVVGFDTSKLYYGDPELPLVNYVAYISDTEGAFENPAGIDATTANWDTGYVACFHLLNNTAEIDGQTIYNSKWADGSVDTKPITFYVLGSDIINWRLFIDDSEYEYIPDQDYYGSAIEIDGIAFKGSDGEVIPENTYTMMYYDNSSLGVGYIVVTEMSNYDKRKYPFDILDGKYELYYNSNGYHDITSEEVPHVTMNYSDNIKLDEVNFKWLSSYVSNIETSDYTITFDSNTTEYPYSYSRNITKTNTNTTSHTSWTQAASDMTGTRGEYIQLTDVKVTNNSDMVTGFTFGVTKDNKVAYLQAIGVEAVTDTIYNPATLYIPTVTLSPDKYEYYDVDGETYTISFKDYTPTQTGEGGVTKYISNGTTIEGLQPNIETHNIYRYTSISYSDEYDNFYIVGESVILAETSALQNDITLNAQWFVQVQEVGKFSALKQIKTDTTYIDYSEQATVSYSYDTKTEKIYDSEGGEQSEPPASVRVYGNKTIRYIDGECDFIDSEGNKYFTNSEYANLGKDIELTLVFSEAPQVDMYGPFTLSDWYCTKNKSAESFGAGVSIVWDANGGYIERTEDDVTTKYSKVTDYNYQEREVTYTWSGWTSTEVVKTASEGVYVSNNTTLSPGYTTTIGSSDWGKVTVPTPIRDGYVFDGFNGELSGNAVFQPNYNFYGKALWHEAGTMKPTKSNEFYYPYIVYKTYDLQKDKISDVDMHGFALYIGGSEY